MKKVLFILIPIFLLSIPAFADQKGFSDSGQRLLLKADGTWEYLQENTNSEYDFRKTNWGMSQEEVVISETEEPKIFQENIIAYETRVSDLSLVLGYIFVNNYLTAARYILDEKHTNENSYIYDYKKLCSLMSKKYGTPKIDESIWRNDTYKNDYSQRGFAMSMGHVFYQSKWETDNTEILCLLDGDNFDIKLVIQYKSTDLKDMDRNFNESKILDQL
jgi:hypothetical protein